MSVAGTVEGAKATSVVRTGDGSAENLPFRLRFVISAYNTAQQMIRFSDEKPTDQRLYWCHDVLRYPVEEYLTHLRALSDHAVPQEMVHS